MSNFQEIKQALAKLADQKKAKHSARFFKTGPGQYGEGDQFLGIVVPDQRTIAKRFAKTTSLSEIEQLLASPWHEHRLVALLILTYQYPKANLVQQKNIHDFYLKHTNRVNNWDLVDLSAPNIVGQWMLLNPSDRKLLKKLSKSTNIWERRVAVLATYPLIKHKQYTEILDLAAQLLTDQHDLMHKAVGWMLREVGKQDLPTLLNFLDQHASSMPRTMLRYSIEKLPENQRKNYLSR